MFYWILWAILWASWDITYKKSLMISWNIISNNLYQLIWNFFMFLLLWIFLIFYWNLQAINYQLLVLLIVASFISIFSEYADQYSYKNEKISVLLPYGESETIFTIIFWFILFSDNSIISLIFWLIAWLIIIIWSIDYKNLKVNKYCMIRLLSWLWWSIKYIILGFILLEISVINSMFFLVMVSLILISIISLFRKEINSLKKVTTKISKFIFLENFNWILYILVTLFMIKEFWIVMSVLLWMIYIIFSLIFSYIFFKDTPEKKDLIVVTMVFICVNLWVFLW